MTWNFQGLFQIYQGNFHKADPDVLSKIYQAAGVSDYSRRSPDIFEVAKYYLT